MMSAVILLGLLLVGRAVSLVVYQSTWKQEASAKAGRGGLFANYLRRWQWWPLHAVWLWWGVGASWESWPMLRPWAVTACWILAVSAIGRMGPGHQGRLFRGDRLLVLVFSIAATFAPGWLYPAMLAACCLQYAGAGWRLSPGYSNLLGFEFVRGSLSVLVACWMVRVLAGEMGHGALVPESLMVAAVVGYQASYYFMQALSKCALGRHWWSWMVENRVACLVRNAHLRGWCPTGGRRRVLLAAADQIERLSVVACAGAWILEIGWLIVLVGPRAAVLWWSLSMVFHLIVFALTGLLAWQFVLSHAAWCLAVVGGVVGLGVFSLPHTVVVAVGALMALAGVATVRRAILQSCHAGRGLGEMQNWSDAADLLMTWWDSPLMRFYSWEGETTSGRRVAIPVTAFSPHDTTITDLPTHLMILGLHGGLDRRVVADGAVARTGVWGLLISVEERDFLYDLMDRENPDLAVLQTSENCLAWESFPDREDAGEIAALGEILTILNEPARSRWQVLLRRWPHFPGEDLVPDICPLVDEDLPRYRFDSDERLRLVRLKRLRTWQDRGGLRLLENSLVGTIWLVPKDELS